jgi:predicted aldo/keto reductase-like oxidoreductase
MDHKNLGRSGLKVSRICLGTNNFGGQVSEEASIRIVNKAVDCGINLIGTVSVPLYSQARHACAFNPQFPTASATDSSHGLTSVFSLGIRP